MISEIVLVLGCGWVVFSWYCINFLGTMFPVFFGKRYFIICRWYSLYKNLDDQKQMVGVSTDGVSVFLSFLMVVLTSCCF